MAMRFADAGLSGTIFDGSLIAACGVAALVGMIGFLSPCVLPLVPGYLSYLAGMAGEPGRARPRRMITAALLFGAGFTVVLVATSDVLFAGLGHVLAVHRILVERCLGVVTIALGAVFLGAFAFTQREARFRRLPPAGLVGAPVLGAAFGLAWTPCLTPTFAAVIGLASTESTAGRGAVLTTAYCLGLTVPFVLLASGLGWATSAVGFLRRHTAVVHRLSGALLIALGVLLVTATWTSLMDAMRAWTGPGGIGSGL